MNPGPAPARRSKDLLDLLPILYVAFFLGFFGLAWHTSHAMQVPAPTHAQDVPISPSATNPHQAEVDELVRLKTELDLQQDYLEKRSAQVDKRADDLEHLIVEMTVGSGIYTLLLGLFAYFSLKAIKSDAQTDLKTIRDLLSDFKKNEFADFREDLQASATREIELARTEFDSFRSEVRNDIPELYGMARSLGVILERIRRQVDLSRNWKSRATYDALLEEQRQTILIAEMTVAGFDYFGLPASSRFRSAAAEIYLNLAAFYASRSRKTSADKKFNQEDMKRAFLYIDRACFTDPNNPRSFYQRAAMLLMDVTKEGDRPSKEQMDNAAADLDQSLAIDPGFTRSLYNMAWILRRRNDLPRAIELLTKIVDARQSLKREDRGEGLINALVNRACYRALLLGTLSPDAEKQPDIQKVSALILADCEAACEEGKLYGVEDYCRESLSREFAPKGDLFEIGSRLLSSSVPRLVACA
jgi:tetratricopeptide (TPR) repeat protein